MVRKIDKDSLMFMTGVSRDTVMAVSWRSYAHPFKLSATYSITGLHQKGGLSARLKVPQIYSTLALQFLSALYYLHLCCGLKQYFWFWRAPSNYSGHNIQPQLT